MNCRFASLMQVNVAALTVPFGTRRSVAEWLVERLVESPPMLVGIDHGFSFPLGYFEAHRLGVHKGKQCKLHVHGAWSTSRPRGWLPKVSVAVNN